MPIYDPHFSTADTDSTSGWHVTSLVDPAGTGGDLAFTQGLSDFELPELLLWARPTEGLDPGVDWLLTHRERSRLLNRWAIELINDTLSPGMEREERFDGGHSVARFRFSRPVEVSPLQYPYLPAQAHVMCTAWSLLRRATAPPAPLRASATRRMERWITDAEALTLRWQQRPDTLDRSGVPRRIRTLTEPQQLDPLNLGPPESGRFGPLTPWVQTRIGQVLAADPDVLAAFLDRLRLAAVARCEDDLLDDLLRLATRLRRHSACREVSRVAQELGLAVAGPPGYSTPLWLRSVAITPALLDPGPAAESGLRTLLSDGLEVLLIASALADVAPPTVMASGSGPWAWAAAESALPGRFWLAAPQVRQTARDLLASATPDLLAEAVSQAARMSTTPQSRALSRLVVGLQTTAAACARPRTLIRREQSRGLPRSIAQAADQLAGHLLTALAVPDRFPDDSRSLLREMLRPLVPELPGDLRPLNPWAQFR